MSLFSHGFSDTLNKIQSSHHGLEGFTESAYFPDLISHLSALILYHSPTGNTTLGPLPFISGTYKGYSHLRTVSLAVQAFPSQP